MKTVAKPIQLHLRPAQQYAAEEALLLSARFAPLKEILTAPTCLNRAADESQLAITAMLTKLGEFLRECDRLDVECGADAELPIDYLGDAVADSAQTIEELSQWAARLGAESASHPLHDVSIGLGLWALRHGIPLMHPAPTINSLAHRANSTTSRQEAAAVFGLMQGLIDAMKDSFADDLERSNPQRPWRVLLINFAITGIKTGDLQLMRFSFDTLGAYLPEECAGFFQETSQFARTIGMPANIQETLDAEAARWAKRQ